jgi:hypothetical protein
MRGETQPSLQILQKRFDDCRARFPAPDADVA